MLIRIAFAPRFFVWQTIVFFNDQQPALCFITGPLNIQALRQSISIL